ncbi:MAG: hypothetical protein J6I52_09255 [Prevotella sp.]|nr:hypothetical protein [Prevotella sp.]MBP3842588.1 hypothetical protein [Prevotella sp.]
MKRKLLTSFSLAALLCLSASAQTVKLNGVGHNNRYDDGEQMKTEYVGYNYDLQKSIFIVDNGLYTMSWDGSTLTTPTKEPPVNKADIKGNNDKELWANNFNMMYGNSGTLYVDGKLITIMSRDEQSTTDEVLFAVRKWDAKTGDLLSTEYRPKSDCLESAGMAYNPKDGKIYGLFYLTEQKLSEEFTEDPDFFVDEDGDSSDEDAGYALCELNPQTMKITPITKGLYYYNFITFAINSEGRAFALTSGASSAPEGEDGRQRDINGNLVGAQLCEFDLTTGLMIRNAVQKTDAETGEIYTDYEFPLSATGYSSQFRRQSACFDKNNPNKMYWNGYFNSGKGINEYGSWTTLSDKEWRTNGKYDTALYEIDITTGVATRLSKIANRWTFSAMWVDGADVSDGANIEITGSNEPTDGTYLALQHADNGSIWQQVEMGKQYTYYLQPANGWVINSVTFNGNELEIKDGSYVTTPAINANISRLIVTFEETAVNAIESIQEETSASPVKVLGKRGGIIVNNADGKQLSIFNAKGQQLLTQQVKGEQASVELAEGQLYIVKVGDKVMKIRL